MLPSTTVLVSCSHRHLSRPLLPTLNPLPSLYYRLSLYQVKLCSPAVYWFILLHFQWQYVLVILSCVVASAGLFFAWWIWKQKGKNRASGVEMEEKSPSDLCEIVLRSKMDKVKIEEWPLYGFEILVAATNNFNPSNKLGMGGFRLVYKGTLACGMEIAVKRLSNESGQGYEDFMNESGEIVYWDIEYWICSHNRVTHMMKSMEYERSGQNVFKHTCVRRKRYA